MKNNRLLPLAMLIITLAFQSVNINVLAQAPQKMSYQAVIRNSNNALLSSAFVGVKISILQGSAAGTAVYSETQTPKTNANGLISIEIGGGNGFDAINWENNVTSGNGKSYGGELLVQKRTGKFSGWIGYTLSWTKQQFDSLNFGKEYYARYDRRHDISLVGIYKISNSITLSAVWVYGTGNALTMAQSSYYAPSHELVENKSNYPSFYGDMVDFYKYKNNFRMAAYHRLDVGIQFHKKTRWGERTWEISAYNAYNRKNPFFYYSDTEIRGSQVYGILKQVTLFPIIPSISYSFKF